MQRNKLFLLFSSIFVFLLFFLAPLDTDLGWHLRYGEYIVKTWHFLRVNTLTYYLQGFYWANSYTIYQILVYFIYKVSGLIGFNIACSLLMLASYYFFCRTYPRLAKTSFFLFLFISIFSWQIFDLGLRSQLFSFFFTIIVFYVLEKSDVNSKFLYTLPPVFFIWANVHGAFPFGLFVFFVFLLEKIFHKGSNLHLISLVLFISLLATLINPYGFGVYIEGLTHVTYALGSLIAEWVPPSLIDKLVVGFLFYFTVMSLFLTNSRRKFFWVTVVSFFVIFSITARRNIPFAALAFAESFAFIFRDKLVAFENNQKFTVVSVITLVAAIFYVSITMLPVNYIASTNSAAYCNNSFVVYPCKAVEFLKKNGIKNENIFANYEWGGFLEWELPQDKYFVDGRMPTWKTPEGLSPYTVFLNVIQAQPGYEETLDKYKTDLVLITQGSYLDLELISDKSTWREIYRDGVSVIYSNKKI
jgi:hypothetical protein